MKLNNLTATEVYMAQTRIHYAARQIAMIRSAESQGIAHDGKSADWFSGLMAGNESMIECLLMAHDCYNGFQTGVMEFCGERVEYKAYDLSRAVKPAHAKVLFSEEAA